MPILDKRNIYPLKKLESYRKDGGRGLFEMKPAAINEGLVKINASGIVPERT